MNQTGKDGTFDLCFGNDTFAASPDGDRFVTAVDRTTVGMLVYGRGRITLPYRTLLDLLNKFRLDGYQHVCHLLIRLMMKPPEVEIWALLGSRKFDDPPHN